MGELLSADQENARGAELIVAGRLHDAAEAFVRACAIQPDHAASWANLGATLKVRQTPTYYINGRKLIGDTITPPQYFDYLIELALKETK